MFLSFFFFNWHFKIATYKNKFQNREGFFFPYTFSSRPHLHRAHLLFLENVNIKNLNKDLFNYVPA